MTGYKPFDRDLDKVVEPLDQTQRRRRSGVVVLEDAVDKAQVVGEATKGSTQRYAVIAWRGEEICFFAQSPTRVDAVAVVSAGRGRELWDLRTSPPRRIRLRGMGR